MSDPDSLEALPEDDEEAFVVFERAARTKLEAKQDDGWAAEIQYVTRIRAFVDEFELDIDLPSLSPGNYGEFFSAFDQAVQYYGARKELKIRRGRRRYMIAQIELNQEYRKEIHDLIAQIRAIVGKTLGITERKRDTILGRLNDLAKEIDRAKTRTEAFFALVLDASEVAGEAAEKVEPLVRQMERVFASARSSSGDLAIEQEERKLLPPPERDNSGGGEASGGDDEIGSVTDADS